MYLSLLKLNPESSQVRADLSDLREMHRSVMRGFTDLRDDLGPARAGMGVLYRVSGGEDQFEWGPAISLLVQSGARPDWGPLPSRYLVTPAEVRELDPLLDSLERGRLMRFKLVGNATANRRPAGGGPRKRVGLYKREELVPWLLRQLGEVSELESDGTPTFEARDLGRHRGGRGRQGTTTIRKSEFSGTMRVRDPAGLRQKVEQGVGRAKAYGCGLLTLAPP